MRIICNLIIVLLFFAHVVEAKDTFLSADKIGCRECGSFFPDNAPEQTLAGCRKIRDRVPRSLPYSATSGERHHTAIKVTRDPADSSGETGRSEGF